VAGVGCGGERPSSGASTSQLQTACIALDAGVCPTPPPSFAADIQPLLDRSCNRTCHGAPGTGLWPLVGYQNVADWGASISYDVGGCWMPPGDAGPGVTETERQTIVDWVSCGAPNN
jgi:hypothetical protein